MYLNDIRNAIGTWFVIQIVQYDLRFINQPTAVHQRKIVPFGKRGFISIFRPYDWATGASEYSAWEHMQSY